ncbi:MAG: class III extradiol ring-cleavage dioxygenase [Pseudomonadota bacterium]
MKRQPVLFVSHGAPTLPLEPTAARDFLRTLGRELERPRAVLAVSAHWATVIPHVTGAYNPSTIHDFWGFPHELYAFKYPAPGAPELAQRAVEALEAEGFEAAIDAERGLDHGAWVPLLIMFPQADVPVVQLSIQPHLGPRHHLHLGEALAPLREEGILVLASGSATHNLYEFGRYALDAAPPAWVAEFSDWLARHVEAGDTETLLAYRRQGPQAAHNHPTEEHLLPLFVALGAGGRGERVHRSFAHGILAMDVYRFH